MTVYELIQELSNYKADTEVTFHVNAEFTTDVEVGFDRESPGDVRSVTADANFDEYVEFNSIIDRETKSAYRDIVIHLTYQD